MDIMDNMDNYNENANILEIYNINNTMSESNKYMNNDSIGYNSTKNSHESYSYNKYVNKVDDKNNVTTQEGKNNINEQKVYRNEEKMYLCVDHKINEERVGKDVSNQISDRIKEKMSDNMSDKIKNRLLYDENFENNSDPTYFFDDYNKSVASSLEKYNYLNYMENTKNNCMVNNNLDIYEFSCKSEGGLSNDIYNNEKDILDTRRKGSFNSNTEGDQMNYEYDDNKVHDNKHDDNKHDDNKNDDNKNDDNKDGDNKNGDNNNKHSVKSYNPLTYSFSGLCECLSKQDKI